MAGRGRAWREYLRLEREAEVTGEACESDSTASLRAEEIARFRCVFFFHFDSFGKRSQSLVEQCGKILEGSPGYLKVLNETKDISEREFLAVLAGNCSDWSRPVLALSHLLEVANAQEWLERELEAHKKLLPHEETTFTSHAIDKRCGKIIKDVCLL